MHGAVASYAFEKEGRSDGAELVEMVKTDWTRATASEALEAAMALVVQMTDEPAGLTEARFLALRRAGVSDEGIDRVVQICACFNVISRVADTLQFELLSEKQLASVGGMLYRNGYA